MTFSAPAGSDSLKRTSPRGENVRILMIGAAATNEPTAFTYPLAGLKRIGVTATHFDGSSEGRQNAFVWIPKILFERRNPAVSRVVISTRISIVAKVRIGPREIRSRTRPVSLAERT